MKIATYYGDKKSCGRNDGGPLYAAYCLSKIFGKENVTHIFPQGDLNHLGKFDLHWLTDFGEDALGYQDFELPSPSIYWASDTHLGFDYRLSRAKRCDWVFCAQRKAKDEFIAAGIPEDRCFWLPHAFHPMAYSKGIFNKATNLWMPDAVPQKKYDVCFIGNLNDENRVKHLDRLFKEFPNFYWGTQRFHDAAEKFNQSRIVFNVSSRKELNMRHFEALGSGSFLLTDNIPTSENVFDEGQHFVGYDSLDEMIEKAHYYLEHETEREAIAQAGHLEAVSNHTYMHRVIAVLEKVGVGYDRDRTLKVLPQVPAGVVAA